MTTYQKLKAENLKLKQQLITVATKPNTLEAVAILFQWKINADCENVAWFGNVFSDTKGISGCKPMKGIIKHIS